MSKLCFSTFVSILIKCKADNKNATQKGIVAGLISIIDPSYQDRSDDIIRTEVSNYVKGKRDLSSAVYDRVSGVLDYTEYTEMIERKIVVLIDPNKRTKAIKAIIKLIMEDDIEAETVVEEISNTKKCELTENVDFAQFLAGVFLYVLKNTNNYGTEAFSKEITDEYIEDAAKKFYLGEVDENSENSILNEIETRYITTRENEEKTIQEARKFCILYENEINLLPLCQIANNIDANHNNVRQMYTDFSMERESVQRKILELKEVPFMLFPQGWIQDCIKKYVEEIEHEGLTTINFLYEGGKYLNRAYTRYANREITEHNPRIFERPDSTGVGDGLTSLSYYMVDFFYFKETDPKRYIKPPMDYLWDRCNLGSCAEEDMTYWTMKFIIDSSFLIMPDEEVNDARWNDIYIQPELICTQEDMYFYALFQLYKLYIVDRKN